MFDMTGKYIRDISKMDFATRYGESSVLKKSDMVSRSCRSFEPLKTAEPVLNTFYLHCWNCDWHFLAGGHEYKDTCAVLS